MSLPYAAESNQACTLLSLFNMPDTLLTRKMTSSKSTRTKALIIEDKDRWIRELKQLLEEAQFEVDAAKNVDEALSLIKNNRYDLATIDIHLSEEGPHEAWRTLADAIRRHQRSIAIIMVTGYPSMETVIEALNYFAISGYFNKNSFDSNDFLEKLEKERLTIGERKKIEELEAELLRRQTNELEEARQLQLSMLPQEVPQHPSVVIAADMKPATVVGGDYYDFHLANDGTLTIAIGDAADKGMKAGMMVAVTKGLFSQLAKESDIVQALKIAHHAFKGMKIPPNIYMTLALIRLKGNRLELANAGMPPAFIHRAALQKIDEIRLPGFWLGFNEALLRRVDDFRFSSTTIDLAPGDTILLMSDGITDQPNDQREFFDDDRARAAFKEVANRLPDEIIAHLFEKIDDWRKEQPQKDDITFVVIQRKRS